MKRKRVLIATALFDGHDVSINIYRKLLLARGAEVIHLGHNRPVKEIVAAAVEEDVDAILLSSYQGGHNEYLRFLLDSLKENDLHECLIFAGGGGTIQPSEINKLHELGITRVYHAQDGQRIGIEGIADDIINTLEKKESKSYFQNQGEWISWLQKIADVQKASNAQKTINSQETIKTGKNHWKRAIGQGLSFIEDHVDQAIEWFDDKSFAEIKTGKKSVVIGITGTGGAGKSSLVDELIRNFLLHLGDVRIGVLAVDPSKRQTGGALLADRIRMGHIYDDRVYFRSLATRDSGHELTKSIDISLSCLKKLGFDLLILESSGIGQGGSQIVDVSDISMYVMTREFGASTQLDKIDMLDYADMIVINKFEKSSSSDALREVLLHVIRTKNVKVPAGKSIHEIGLPVFGTSANQFNNTGVRVLSSYLIDRIKDIKKKDIKKKDFGQKLTSSEDLDLVKPNEQDLEQTSGTSISSIRSSYLSEIADLIENYHRQAEDIENLAKSAFSLKQSVQCLQADSKRDAGGGSDELKSEEIKGGVITGEENKNENEKIGNDIISGLQRVYENKWKEIPSEWQGKILSFSKIQKEYMDDEFTYKVRGKEIKTSTHHESLSGLRIPKIAIPNLSSWDQIVRFLHRENFPGNFPYTAGVFPFKRQAEDPKRMFAGEGGPLRTNKRFHLLCENEKAKRLSVAFDGITLYGEDPSTSPDIFGKIGESGVSICTIDDMDQLLDGFNLIDPLTSVSMTINGPAPIMLAMYFITAYRRELKKLEDKGKVLSEEEKEELKIRTFQCLRGTVQADILKEDQAQNTCIYNLDFALKMIGDIQNYFSQHSIYNYYSISISGYHIAEAGANPITQLALTLANGFHYVEYFLSRGLKIDDFAGNLSFFFSNGMEPEFSVIGRVARRIWAIAMKERYHAKPKGQKLKYHIQTSGRSLHASEVEFNDIRTTCQALFAFYDNCNSLHTNAYDEAITTPTEESVRRSMAIQLILSNEFGLLKNENPNQGSYILEILTDMVEKAVLDEFRRISERGGVLGAMESGYQRSKIQEDSIYYENKKHSGEYPLIGVNTYLNPNDKEENLDQRSVIRATLEEKNNQLSRLKSFQLKHKDMSIKALDRLKKAALNGDNIFQELLNTVNYCSLGQITSALYEVGGKYRRSI